MRAFLDMLDHNENLYLGSPTTLDIEFAHGGTGYVVSRQAMRTVIEENPSIEDHYEPEVQDICCGDRMPAKILKDKGIKLTRTWPMFNGEKPFTVAFSQKQWCQPVVTMHHMSPLEISDFWNFEQTWKKDGNERPMLWMDVYYHFVQAHLEAVRTGWTNWAKTMVFEDGIRAFEVLSEGSVEKASVESPRNCAALCESVKSCLSWEHHHRTCSLGKNFKFGQNKMSEDHHGWTSGWHLERITRFRDQMGNCSQGPDWRYSQSPSS